MPADPTFSPAAPLPAPVSSLPEEEATRDAARDASHDSYREDSSSTGELPPKHSAFRRALSGACGYVMSRWREGWTEWRESRRRLLLRKDYRHAMRCLFSMAFALSVGMALGRAQGPLGIVAFVCLLWGAVVMLAWWWAIGLITVGNLLFDNIPSFSDIASIVDMADGAGMERLSLVSAAFKKREGIQEWVTVRLRLLLVKITLASWQYSRRFLQDSRNAAFRDFRIEEAPVFLIQAMLLFMLPITVIASLGFFGLLTGLRPTLARLPILLAAFLATVAAFIVALFFTGMGFQAGAFFVMLLWFFAGYTYFFVEEGEYVIARRISLFLRDKPMED